MERREFLKTAAFFPFASISLPKDFGYLPPVKPNNLPTFSEVYPKVEDGKGKVSLLYPYLEKVLAVSSLKSHAQTGPDCVSQATGLSNDITAAIQILLRNERFNGKIATEWIHFGGRCVIGGSRNINGGAHIVNACKFIQDYGVIFRKKYQKIDFTNYKFRKSNFKNINDWPELLKEASKHKMGTLTKISNWKEARAALRNLAPVVLGSSLGFNGAKRDSQGFAQPSGSWYHAWMIMGFDDRFKRKGGLLMNSHGVWVQGPRRHHQPNGSIWVDIDVLDEMISKMDDAYALSDYVGTKPIKFPLY